MNFKTVIASITKVLAIVLVLTVLLPSGLKFSHVFSHHTHEVCETDSKDNTHFHELDLDCDFYKFKLSKNHFFVINKPEQKAKVPYVKQTISYYISYNNYQQLSRFLRGPPELV